MRKYVKLKKPSDAQLDAMKRRYEIKNDRLVVKSKDKTRMAKTSSFAGPLQSQGN